MEKKLSEMSLEELWKLFPIYLTEHQPYWKEWYTDEESFLTNRVPKIERISHIGSTAINSIYAKPIIDILVEISKDYCLSDYKEVIVILVCLKLLIDFLLTRDIQKKGLPRGCFTYT